MMRKYPLDNYSQNGNFSSTRNVEIHICMSLIPDALNNTENVTVYDLESIESIEVALLIYVW